MNQDVYDAIVSMANANGIDPAYALAIAQRESDFDVNGGSGSKLSSAYGLFQLLKGERAKYGGSSSDPVEQATAWGRYIGPVKQEMASVLGRDPTGAELYTGHYWGGVRAARMATGEIPPDTPVQDVFTRSELAANPNIGRAGTTGRLYQSVTSDIDRRAARFGADPSQVTAMPSHPMNTASIAGLGTPYGDTGSSTSGQPASNPDIGSLGAPASDSGSSGGPNVGGAVSSAFQQLAQNDQFPKPPAPPNYANRPVQLPRGPVDLPNELPGTDPTQGQLQFQQWLKDNENYQPGPGTYTPSPDESVPNTVIGVRG